jgi:hypothetical protein
MPSISIARCSSRPARHPTAIQHGLRARQKPRPTYTADTPRDLRAEYDKRAELIFIWGADNLAQVLRRHRSREHLRLPGLRRLPGVGTLPADGPGRIGARTSPSELCTWPDGTTPPKPRAGPAATWTGPSPSSDSRHDLETAVLIGLPPALRPGGEGISAWIAETFLQLVLLSIIIVGQNIAAAASGARSETPSRTPRRS